MLKKIAGILGLLVLVAVTGCAKAPQSGPPAPQQRQIEELEHEILALGPEVDPAEAARAARLAYEYAHQLAIEYKITDPPLVHNYKVNRGLRPRGLCYHWAEDMESRLLKENYRTLDIHRAIGNPDKVFRIDHSTAIVSRRGDNMYQGLVLDPWRNGGALHWAPVVEDKDYDWQPRLKVHEKRRQKKKS
ncbi:MAG: hypothetical protein GY952_09665 [Rhodobacteraceae bacterium]|nr:hypothetical protein [Paracoccaceae bacterium]